MPSSQIIVPFHGSNLTIVEHNGEPYTPMKPIVEGMGMSWQGQHAKLKANSDRWGINVILIPSVDVHNPVICSPLRKLFGWLQTLQPNRVRVDIRDKVIQYQNECDDVLWKY
ncbi:phage antirepressor N-terminal domain-containing protein [Vibrio coralliilyticus]|uniref:phage antirepressor N-terminal domain-containing protein n=1 Tax=Vibrio coralliilyticus TaxID=190893 RepID=UPI0015617FD2|nr:phage antirepressor N-terminal domain-containing protein [Vibrio coralliilyticus]NRF28250.1 phage antirepressor N-terminal domain-containing protein [Vibrio coralliilyticus]NRF51939.1 phage antirepressor N-terminal domain-containing protein [Vibrio coralliilyticus]NRG05550.1 phage antirepressor N-terminal domain-containing protein [Vibrio coralliilyticus]